MTVAASEAGTSSTILLTGATGYVGGCLLSRLEGTGQRVRCLTRRPEALRRPLAPSTHVVVGDLLDRGSLGQSLLGVNTAYYLVHSMGSGGDFEELDRRAARNFAAEARDAGVERIVYLGGLGSGDGLSAHLASRHEVGDILRSSGVPTIELRASIVIGSGSASFETVRALVERLPAIPAPPSADTAAQPIGIDDVIEYLMAAGQLPGPNSLIIEIGGRDTVTYTEVMREYARQRRLRRRVVALPPVAVRASRVFLGLLMPSHGRIAAAMVDSLRNETVVESSAARDTFAITPSGLGVAIERAMLSDDREFADTLWSDALPPSARPRWGGVPFRRRMVTSRVIRVPVLADDAFTPIQQIGGPTGWYGVDWFWRLRGRLDRLRGGEGLRRGRRDPLDLRVGDRIDFWRVEGLRPGRRLLLAAEMKMPGRLWLQYDVEEDGGATQIRQTTVFDPGGYVGLIYWYLLYPVHHGIFGAVLRGLRSASTPAGA
jgi:uncharacterized protein YbjT (DUF2867 family)